MEKSILNSIKKALGIDENYDVFDQVILMHTNSIFSVLNQLGIGPKNGFEVVDDKVEWETYTRDDKMLNLVKSYIFIQVRLLFDPPTTSFAIEALKKQATEYEWRLNVYMEGAGLHAHG